VWLAQEEAAKHANVGRNYLCPCGSERKFKWCHGGTSTRAVSPCRDLFGGRPGVPSRRLIRKLKAHDRLSHDCNI